jgi:hypothetical protein
MSETESHTDFLDMVDNLMLTSTKIQNINDFLNSQIHITEKKNTDDNFSKLYTLIDYNTEQINILKDRLNELWKTLNKQINNNINGGK